jgi:hypothetical protein
MARPKLPRDENGEIIREGDEQTEQAAGEMVSGMSPAMLKALVESLVGAAMAGQASTADAIQNLIKEQGRTTLKSNAQHPDISVYSHPEGNVAHPKAKLDKKTYLNSIQLHEDTLTPAEIELLNALDSDRECRGGRWKVQIKDGRRLLWMPIKTMDDRAQLPESLSIILLELATGSETLNPNFLVDEVLKLRQQVAELQLASA